VFITRGVWNQYELDVNFANDTVSAFYDGVAVLQGASFTTTGTNLDLVAFYSQQGATTDQAFFDNLSITTTAVPEPGTLVLLLGAGALVVAMRRPTKFLNRRAALLVLVGLAPLASADITYTDGFEGSSFNPFWTVGQMTGTVSLSTNEAHSGTQSAEFASAPGAQRFLTLSHTFSSPMTGTASVWFYDNAPGQQTLYEQLQLFTAGQNVGYANVGTQDFDAFCYAAGLATAYGEVGPNANCGLFPQEETTDVARTTGWHLLSITMGPSATSVSIDGAQMFSYAGSFTFDTVQIDVQGPAFRPDTVAYFDDFSIMASSVPEPGTLVSVFLSLIAFAGYLYPKWSATAPPVMRSNSTR